MRMPIKLNGSWWPARLFSFLPGVNDPRYILEPNPTERDFARAVSSLKFGTTFKTTDENRYPLTLNLICSTEYNETPVILDIGSSVGLASIELMHRVPFSRFYITDLHLEIFHETEGAKTFFYDTKGHCIMIATDRIVVYDDINNALFPFGSLVPRFFKSSKVPELTRRNSQSLVSPAIRRRQGEHVKVECYDIFEAWPNERLDIVITANLLNRSYFPDEDIRRAISNIRRSLNENALWAIIDNRKRGLGRDQVEKSTLFRFRDGEFLVEQEVNGGTDISDLVVSR